MDGATNRTDPCRTRGDDSHPTRAWLLILTLVAAVWLAPATPIRINWTRSAPLGLYAINRLLAPTRNDLVAICLEEAIARLGRSRGYLSAGDCPSGTGPVLKEVAAVAGDEIELQASFFAVNGRIVDSSQLRPVDSAGQSLEFGSFGRHIVPDGEVWVLGVHRERSWDSRYFGPIPVSSIVSVTRPLLTLGMGKAR